MLWIYRTLVNRGKKYTDDAKFCYKVDCPTWKRELLREHKEFVLRYLIKKY